MQQFFRVIFATILLALLLPSTASATGPRVTTSLFTPHANQIHAMDFPPFISTEVIDGGIVSELITTARQRAGIDAEVTTHPVERMVDYYLLQEKALAEAGWHFNFTKQKQEQLIFVPIVTLSENYFYYRPKHPQGLNISSSADLKGMRYGAHKGEEKSEFTKAGAEVYFGRTITMLKKLKLGELDFICAPPEAVDWLVERYMKEDKKEFVTMPDEVDSQVLYVVFNRQHPLAEEAANKFRKELSAMKKDSTMDKITSKYLGGGESGKLFLRRLESFK